MAIQNTSMKFIICGVVLLLMVFPQRSFSATSTYTVGGGNGWGPGHNYAVWAKPRPFTGAMSLCLHRGDVLVFEYQEGYAVQEVSSKEFSKCDGSNPLHQGFNGKTSIPLKTVGIHFFICGYFDMCPDGMNMTIKVT